MTLNSNNRKYLVNKGYAYDIKYDIFYKIYKDVLDVTIMESYTFDQIQLDCFFNININGLIDNFSFSTFPRLEVEKQLTEIFGSCGFYITTEHHFQIIFYIQEKENLIK